MRSSEKEKLLKDVIQDGEYERYREDTFRRTSRAFRRRHRKFHTKWLALAASLLALAGIFYSNRPKERPSQPLARENKQSAEDQTIHTVQNFATVVRTEAIDERVVIRTVANKSLLVTTRRSFPEISDAQLMALLKNRASGFIEQEDGRRFVILH